MYFNDGLIGKIIFAGVFSMFVIFSMWVVKSQKYHIPIHIVHKNK